MEYLVVACFMRLMEGGGSIQKRDKVRLTGKALAKLNLDIHERDDYKCVVSGEYVPLGEKFHHVVRGSNKEDKIEYGVTLSYTTHQDAHNKRAKEIHDKCIEYLKGIYGDIY